MCNEIKIVLKKKQKKQTQQTDAVPAECPHRNIYLKMGPITIRLTITSVNVLHAPLIALNVNRCQASAN